MIERRPPTSREVMDFCSLQFKAPHPFVDCRKGITQITIDDFQLLLNFMSLVALLPKKFDDTSLFDFVQIDNINVGNIDKRPMPAKTSRLSSMT
jgi:hypothetical protein